MTKVADLHIHTHFSDSTSPPEEVVYQANRAGLACIAITDHDTVDGVAPTIEAAKKFEIEVVAGIEMSCQLNSRDIHMLAYCIDYEDPTLIKLLAKMSDSRKMRMSEMIDRLSAMGHGGIALEEVCALSEDSVGRPHLAQIMIEKGVVKNYREAFDKYLAEGQPLFVDKYKQSPIEAIECIKAAGGIAVLAHPMATLVDELIPQFVEAGLGGLEVFYPHNTQATTDFYARIAKKHNLVATGGSDAHGDAKKHTRVGKVKVPYSVVEELKQRCGK